MECYRTARPRTCCVQDCKNVHGKRHRFPKREPEIFQKWLDIIKPKNYGDLTTLQIYNKFVVCDSHFSPDCFVPGTLRGLKVDAVPTVGIPGYSGSEENHEAKLDTSKKTTEAAPVASTNCLEIAGLDPMDEQLEIIKEEAETENVPGTSIAIPDQVNPHEQVDQQREACIACLSTKDLMNRAKDDSVVKMYENLVKRKAFSTNYLPLKVCFRCILLLTQIQKFSKMCRNSYRKLMGLSKCIEILDAVKGTNFTYYNDSKTKILNNFIKFADPPQEGTFEELKKAKIEDTTNQEELDDDVFDNDVSFGEGPLGNSDDEFDEMDDIPLAKRFNIDLEKTKKHLSNPSKIQIKVSPAKHKKYVGNNSGRGRSRGSDLERCSNNFCPACAMRIRNLEEHMREVHRLNWESLTCLNCSFQTPEIKKLLDHSKECTVSEVTFSKECLQQQSDETDQNTIGKNLLCDEILQDDFNGESSCKENYLGFRASSKSSVKILNNELMEGSKRGRKSKKTKHKLFVCVKCEGVEYSAFEGIEIHFREVHQQDSSCILCDQEYGNYFNLVYHMMVKHGKLKCCRLCLVSFKTSAELLAHYKSEEHNTKCNHCGEQFKNRKALYEHRRKKHLHPQLSEMKYKCPECPKEFANPANIKRHVMVFHNDVRFLCDTCGQSYTTNRNLQLHIAKCHEGQKVETKNHKKNFFCDSCGRELKIFHKYSIALHIAKHKGHNYVCKKCSDSFATLEEFNRHVEVAGHHLFSCPQCPSQFVRQENLKLHMKNHDAPGWNKNYFVKYGKSAELRNEKGEFVCKYCPKLFKDKQRLDNHVRVHTNERPYKCHICQKGFKTWIHRKTHINIHLGIKKWVCQYCQKAFTNSCTLKGHEMIHTGERPHKCPECKKGFIAMSAMKKHRQTHFRNVGSGKKLKTKNYEPLENLPEKVEMYEVCEPIAENSEFSYKYGQIFASGDISYESRYSEPPKDHIVGMS